MRFDTSSLDSGCSEGASLTVWSRYPIKWSCISKAALECSVHGAPRHARQPAVRVHADRKLSSPPHTALVLPPDPKVAPEQLLLEVAIPTQAGCPNLQHADHRLSCWLPLLPPCSARGAICDFRIPYKQCMDHCMVVPAGVWTLGNHNASMTWDSESFAAPRCRHGAHSSSNPGLLLDSDHMRV